MSDFLLSIAPAFCLFFAYGLMGLWVLLWLDEEPRYHRHTGRWSNLMQWAALLFWPLATAWVLWKGRAHGQ